MTFNEEELVRIRDSTTGFFNRKARKQVSSSLKMIVGKIDEAKSFDADARKKELIELLNIFTASRQLALQRGAKGYNDPGWAASAACESWLQELLGGNEEGIRRVEILISELIARA